MAMRKDKYRAPDLVCDDAMVSRARYVPVEGPSKVKPWAMPRAARSGARTAHGSALNAPPKVTRGESREAYLILRDGKPFEVPARRGFGGQAAFIDWLNFTVQEDTFYWTENGVPVTDDQLIVAVSLACESIFGFGITRKRPKGANFYAKSWELGENFGMVCYGGQRDTVLISLSGTGLGAAMYGWETRLRAFLEEKGKRVRITRVDLAFDDYSGRQYSVDRAVEDYDAGLFNSGGRNPDIEQRGNWKRPNGKGRTVYVGNRQNGKFLRVYEKGRQLGDIECEWVRIEGELKGVDRDIPLDVLTEPGAYLAAMYPALGWISGRQRRVETVRREAQASYEKLLKWLRHQCGAALWFASEIEGGAEALLAKIKREGRIPPGIKHFENHRTATTPIHKVAPLQVGPQHYLQWA